MKFILNALVLITLLITASVQANEHKKSNEVAPCTNGFDSVNVCQLRS